MSTPSHTTPENFVKFAWELNLRVSTADSGLLDPYFIKNATELAQKNDIEVYYLDFSHYKTAIEALSAKENAEFIAAIDDDSKQSLLWFVNCESLAPLDVDITYSLRTILTTRQSNNTQSVFIAKKEALQQMFTNNQAAFYQSHFPLTGYF